MPHFLGRISPIFSPFFPVFCAFSPSRRGGSNKPQAGTHDISGIWAAFFSRCQRYRCGHRDEASFPSWFAKTACKAKEYGAKGDLVTDDTAAIQKMLDAPECKLATLDKGYYAVSKTLQMVSGATIPYRSDRQLSTR